MKNSDQIGEFLCVFSFVFYFRVGELLQKGDIDGTHGVWGAIEGERGGELLLRAPECMAWTEKRGPVENKTKGGTAGCESPQRCVPSTKPKALQQNATLASTPYDTKNRHVCGVFNKKKRSLTCLVYNEKSKRNHG